MTTTDASSPTASATRQRPNWPLLLLAVYLAPVALQAALLPRSFFDDFPAGRGWIAASGGAYNEHLARDVGVLFAALILASVWTARTRDGDRAVAAAWILQGVGHLAFHTGHLHDLSGPDGFGLVTSLVVVPTLAVVALLYPTRRHLTAAAAGDATVAKR